MKKIVSIIVASIRPENLSGLCANLEETASSPSAFELLVKVDDDRPEMIQCVEEEQQKRSFSIEYIVSPKLEGYYTLNVGYNDLLKIASEETYFVQVVNDQIRFGSPNWDMQLRNYVSYFPDDVFGLRISEYKNQKYTSFRECCYLPDHYGYFTKQWLSLVKGWGEFWGVDTWQEMIVYFLENKCGHKRSIAIDEIYIANEETASSASDGLSEEEWQKKLDKICPAYDHLMTQKSQENFYRLAQKINAYILCLEQGLLDFEIQDDRQKRTIVVKTKSKLDEVQQFPYDINWFPDDYLSSIWQSFRLRRRIGYLNDAIAKFTMTVAVRTRLKRAIDDFTRRISDEK